LGDEEFFGNLTAVNSDMFYMGLSGLLLFAGFPLNFGTEIQGLFNDPEVAFSRSNS